MRGLSVSQGRAFCMSRLHDLHRNHNITRNMSISSQPLSWMVSPPQRHAQTLTPAN